VALELAAGEHGAAPPRSKSLGPVRGRRTRDPAETGAARTRTPDSWQHPPARTRTHRHRQSRAPAVARGTRSPPRAGTPAQAGSRHHHPKGSQPAAGGPPDSTSLHGRTLPGPRCRVRRGEHTWSPRRRTDTPSKMTLRPLHVGVEPDGPGRASQDWHQEETTPKLNHSCISSAGPGP
jgi:hypothetical protein